MCNNPKLFHEQVRRAAEEMFALQGSEFRYVVIASPIDAEERRSYCVIGRYDRDSISTADGDRKLFTATEFQEHVFVSAIDLSEMLPPNRHWNYIVRVDRPCKECGQYAA